VRIWLIRILGGFACILAIVALLAFDFVRSFQYSVPRYDGELSVDGIGATVRIARDQYAVPHILAESFPDAAFGLGYAHAQDRLWQMEMSRRYLQGRLAELFGNLAFDSDVRIRQLGVYAASEASVEHLRPERRGRKRVPCHT
jgi:penicillin amidase